MGLSEASERLREAFANRDVASDDALFRALVSHPDWMVPTDMLTRLLLDARTVRMIHLGAETVVPGGELWVYGDRKAAQAAIESEARLGTYAADVWGAELFARIGDDVETLRINHLAEAEIRLTLGREQQLSMRSLAAAVELEANFVGAASGLSPSVGRRLRSYGAYLILRDERHGSLTTDAADEGLQNALAVFSAEDSAKAYVKQLTTDTALHLHVDQVDGAALFGEFVGEEHDGVVINPLGPGARLALSRTRARTLA